MNLLLTFVVFTSNILGSFNDPFEFEGNYGPESEPIRQKVFELVVSKEALAQNLTDDQVKRLINSENASEEEIHKYKNSLIDHGVQEDFQHGPLLSELVTPELIAELILKQKKLQSVDFTQVDLENFLYFLDLYGNQRMFYFFRNSPSELLSLDKSLKDHASREGKEFDLPILSSTKLLNGQDGYELKKELLNALFTQEALSLAKSEKVVRNSLTKLDPDFLKKFFGSNAETRDLQIFCSPAGQLFFYWLYQSLNLHLVSEENGMIDSINQVKSTFVHTLGNPNIRAKAFKEKLLAANAGVVFTQESDTFVPKSLNEDGLFLSVEKQNPKDGSYVFLRSDLWERDYEVISIEDYEGFSKGRLNVILATSIQDGTKFLLASAHGNSTKPEDGRLQISLIMEKYLDLVQSLPDLQLIIGIDANTKTEEDVKLLRQHLDALGLIATDIGPTTVKRRMVTVQHAKAGRYAVDEEDYLITLKPEKGGRFQLTNVTVGFSNELPDTSVALPNRDNQSDHYAIGATLTDVYNTTSPRR